MKIAVALSALAFATAVPRSHAGEIGRSAYVFRARRDIARDPRRPGPASCSRERSHSGRLEGRDDGPADEERDRLEPLERALNEKQRALAEDMSEIEAEERELEDHERELERVADALVERLIEDALRQGVARPVR
jgi:hypothetical protein